MTRAKSKPRKLKKLNRKQKKIKTVMHEYKAHKLYSSSGKPVKKREQAIAIALSEARKIK